MLLLAPDAVMRRARAAPLRSLSLSHSLSPYLSLSLSLKGHVQDHEGIFARCFSSLLIICISMFVLAVPPPLTSLLKLNVHLICLCNVTGTPWQKSSRLWMRPWRSHCLYHSATTYVE